MIDDDPSTDRPWIEGRVAGAPEEDRRRWFATHYQLVPQEILDALEGVAIGVAGRRVVDVGCGDGIIDLGLTVAGRPAALVGVDITPTDVDDLGRMARSYAGLEGLPENLSFVTSDVDAIPLPTRSADLVISWSAFEHVDDPAPLLREIRRILRPGGAMFLQIWPLYHSQHGSHLWYFYPEGYEHLLRDHGALAEEVRASGKLEQDVIDATLVDFNTLNRMTLDQLDRAIRTAGFRVLRVELSSGAVNVPAGLDHVPLVDLAVSGIKLVAVPC